MRSCLNCISYEPKVAHQCKDRRTDPVAEKHTANFCEHFDYIRRSYNPEGANAREQSARDALKKLLGD